MSIEVNATEQIIEVNATGSTIDINVSSQTVDVNATTSVIEVTASYNPGINLPIGGATGQVLKKQSNTDYDTYWAADEKGVPYIGATGDVDLGEYELKAGQIELDQSPTGTAGVAVTRWNDAIGSTETTLKGGNVILKNGVDLIARVVNKVTPNTTLTKASYQAVKISGAQGQRLAIALAQANNDNNSADTLGLVTETIPTNQEGFIMTVGNLEGINTTGSLQGETWTDGDVLYLSPTTAGAITNIKPNGSTGHIVVIGYVEYAHQNNGKIYVKIMNGWELSELHDTFISSPANNDALIYESATSLWKNKSIATALGYTPVPSTRSLTINGTSYDLSADRTWSVGTVTSVALSVPTGLVVTSGSPITTSGTIAVGLQSGYAIPTTASATNWDAAYNDKINSAAVTGTTTKTLTLTQQDGGTITASWTDDNTDAVTSVFGRTGAVTAQSGDYTTTQVTEGTNLYYTDSRARQSISLTTTGNSGASTYSNSTGVLNVPTYTLAGLGGISLASLSASSPLSYNNGTGAFSIQVANGTQNGYLSSTDWNTFNGKQSALTLTTTGTSGAATLVGSTLNIPQYSGTNIYNSDGTLTGNRTVSTSSNNLTFTGSNFFNVKFGSTTYSNQFVWLGANVIPSIQGHDSTFSTVRDLALQPNGGKVGVGNNAPSELLEVTGTILQKKNDASGVILKLNNTSTSGKEYWLLSTGSGNTPGAGTLSIYDNTSAAYRLVLTSSGRLLLGTTTESTYLLDVNGTGRFNAASSGSTSYSLEVKDTNTNIGSSILLKFSTSPGFILNTRANGWRLYNDSSTVFMSCVNSSGNVNIGFDESTNRTRLQVVVNSQTTANDGITITDNTSSASSQSTLGFFTVGGNKYIARLGTYVGSGFNQGGLTFNVDNGAGTLNELMRMVYTGNILVNTTTDIASSIFTIASTTKGFLPPRMTSAQRAAISTPATGLIVYQTDGTEGLYENTSTGWRILYNTPSGGSGITRSVNNISTTTTAAAAASTDYVYLISGTTTLTLPTAVGNTNRYTLKNVGTNTVTINTTSSQTIDGSTSITMAVRYTALDVISDGTNWNII